MYKRPGIYFVLLTFGICGFLGINSFLEGQEMDRSDPIKVANYVLKLVIVGDVDGLRSMMHPDQQETYTPFTPERRDQLLKQVENDREKIGKELDVSEIRQLENFSGKPAAAAKIRKKSGDVYVIVLTIDKNLYYYDSFLTLGAKAYKKLNFVKKAK